MSEEIERLIAAEDWRGARRVIRAALRHEPDDHWLLTRLALTHYEEFDYSRALECDQQAFALAPCCPLVLWGLAGSLDMLGRTAEAVAIYRRILRRGKESLAYGPCGEGMARARGLYADSLYRISRCYAREGRRRLALRYLERHLDERGPGCHSIYPLADMRLHAKHQRVSIPAAKISHGPQPAPTG
jgi:tetratricopeptide (TPR) repeat protein